MGVLDRYRANRGLATILAATGRTPGALAAAALVRALGKNAVPRLIDALPRDQSGLIAELLGEVLTNATLPQLVEAGLLSENPLMVSSARRALACARQIDPNRLLEVVLAKGGSIADIADVLLRCKDAVSAKSMLRLLDQARADNHPGTFKLIDQIANPSMTAPLVGFLKNANWQARVQVASTIARFPSEPVRDALVRLLADPDKNVRQAALEGLGALNMPVPIGPVCALLRDPDLLVQAKAIETAVRLNDPESFRHLLPILQDESEHARRAAVEVLNAIGNANVVKDLLSALKDQDWWVRVRAADALGAIGGPAVIEAVLGLLGDPDEFMRRTAVEILNTTKDERAFQHLVRALGDADWWVRERAVDALGNLGDARAVPHLARLLRSDSQAAPAAIRALAALGDPAAVDDLIEILASPDPAVQREALEALRALATPAHAEAIRRALGELTPAAADIREIAQRLAHQAADPAHARGGSSAPGAGRNTGAGPAHARGGAREPLRALAAPRALAAGPAPANAEMTLERPMQPPETGAGSPAPVQAAPAGSVARDPAPGAPAVRPAAAQGIDLACIEPGQVLAGRYKVVRELG
ncbi:MAG: HEAT repeat domain-containing protein, partial [Burkholderiales bacterium]|nr:HEAT repeat domain-containing protein [Burkholderiales bacterium]